MAAGIIEGEVNIKARKRALTSGESRQFLHEGRKGSEVRQIHLRLRHQLDSPLVENWSYGDPAVVYPPSAARSLRLQTGIATKSHEKIGPVGQMSRAPDILDGHAFVATVVALGRTVCMKVRIRAATQRSAQATYTAR
jgi:hypothetical protein